MAVISNLNVDLRDYGRTEIAALELQAMTVEEAPLLSHALKDCVRAQNVTIEWGVRANVMQIFRTQQGVRYGLQMGKTELTRFISNAMKMHVRTIEKECWHGRIDREHHCMAGVLQLLGREPREGDTVRAHMLRPTTIRNLTDPSNDHYFEFDILTELTLEVSPAGPLCRMPSYARLER